MRILDTEVYSIPGIASPGFFDPHVHVAGGGGEDPASASSRTDPITGAELISAGVTGVIGLRGTDTTGITMESVTHTLGKLDDYGISVGYFNGGYTGPTPITGTIQSDMKLLKKPTMYGIKIAYGDHRSPITIKDFHDYYAGVYSGGALAGDGVPGIVHIHLGPNAHRKAHLEPFKDFLTNTPQYQRHTMLTHVNRSAEMLQSISEFAQEFPAVALDVTSYGDLPCSGTVAAPAAIKHLLDAKVSIKRLSMSSDAQGMLIQAPPVVASVAGVPHDFAILVKNGMPLEDALSLVTRNPTQVLGFPAGELEKGKRATITVLDPKTYEPTTVILKGAAPIDCKTLQNIAQIDWEAAKEILSGNAPALARDSQSPSKSSVPQTSLQQPLPHPMIASTSALPAASSPTQLHSAELSSPNNDAPSFSSFRRRGFNKQRGNVFDLFGLKKPSEAPRSKYREIPDSAAMGSDKPLPLIPSVSKSDGTHLNQAAENSSAQKFPLRRRPKFTEEQCQALFLARSRPAPGPLLPVQTTGATSVSRRGQR